MSKLDELINEYCPDGVELKRIEEICINISSGGTPSSKNKDYYGGTIPWLRTQEVNFNNIIKTDVHITEEGLHKSSAKWIPVNCVIIAMYGATVGKVAYNSIPLTTNQACCNLEINPKIANFKYVFHYIISKYEYIKSLGQGSQTNINAQIIKNISIPVPPLPVQEEIVRILDSFTSLTAELQAELQARKKQYEYYKDNIIFANPNTPRKKLEEIAIDIYRGSGIKRDEVVNEGIPCVRYGEIYTSYNNSFTKCLSHTKKDVVTTPKFFEYGDIIFAITGENINEIAKSIVYLGTEKCMAGGDTVVMKHNLEPRYLSYALSTTDAQKQKSAGKVKSKVVHSSIPALKAISIPVPSREQQKKIADILDSFYYLIADISTGIPAEIAARQKQYEYYRDKLLTFKELS